MRIILLGGGSGGHFYPLIAVAQELHSIAIEERIVSLELILMGDQPFDAKLLREERILFEEIPSGKVRRYFSLLNLFDSLKTLHGILRAIWKFTLHPPDLVFSKGGYDSFPVLVAARLYRIPVIIHESDSVPGAVNAWAAKFAKRIGVSFPETASFFPKEKVALVGNPIRRGVLGGSEDEAFDIFELESGVPILLVLGGSQGAEKINEVILSALSELVDIVEIIHSTGPSHGGEVQAEAGVILEKSIHKKRYHSYSYLAPTQLRNASFVSSVVVSRAGSGGIFEIAAWKMPSILIPLSHAAQDHQRQNAYNYARTGAAIVIEESNLTPHVLISEIRKIIERPEEQKKMQLAAGSFARIDAAQKIAREIIRLGIHE